MKSINPTEIILMILGVVILVIALYLGSIDNNNIIISNILAIVGSVAASSAAALAFGAEAAKRTQRGELSMIHDQLLNAVVEVDKILRSSDEEPLSKNQRIDSINNIVISITNELGNMCGKDKDRNVENYLNTRSTIKELTESQKNLAIVQEELFDIQEKAEFGVPVDLSNLSKLSEKIDEMQKNISEINKNGSSSLADSELKKSKPRNVDKNSPAPLSNIELYLARIRRLNMDNLGAPLQRNISELVHEAALLYPEPVTRKELLEIVLNNDSIKGLVEEGQLSKTKVNSVFHIFYRGGAFNVEKGDEETPSTFVLKREFRNLDYFLHLHDAIIKYMDVDGRLNDLDMANFCIRNSKNTEEINPKIYDYAVRQMNVQS